VCVKKGGDGPDTLFWFDIWLGLVPLCVRFRRLFDLYENKSITVANLLEECKTLLFDVSLHVDVSNQCLWLTVPSGVTQFEVHITC